MKIKFKKTSDKVELKLCWSNKLNFCILVIVALHPDLTLKVINLILATTGQH